MGRRRSHKKRRNSRSPESRPYSRRSRGSSSSTEEQTHSSKMHFEKLCVVLKNEVADYAYTIYIIDINSPSNIDNTPYQSLEPTLRLHGASFDDNMAFALLGSKLYMFGGNSDVDGSCQSQMFMLELKRMKKLGPNLKKEDVEDGPSMRGRKFFPIATVLGDSSICVFASVLFNRRIKNRFSGTWMFEDQYSGRPNFELFDTKEECWISLPEPLPASSEAEACAIDAYYTQNSCLCISTDQGVYFIDVADPDRKWRSLDIAQFPYRGGGLRIDNLLYTPINIYKMRGDRFRKRYYPFLFKDFIYAREELFLPVRNRGDSAVALEDDKLYICQAGFEAMDVYDIKGFEDEKLKPNLLINIVDCNQEKIYKLVSETDRQNKSVEVLKTLMFALGSTFAEYVKLWGVFPMKMVVDD